MESIRPLPRCHGENYTGKADAEKGRQLSRQEKS